LKWHGKRKKEGLTRGVFVHPLWDSLIFRQVAAKLGGRVRFMVTGSAPISGEVLDFLRICFSCDVREGYGQTESSAASTATFFGDTVTGHVGVTTPALEMKLVDVPELDYYATDTPPRGEICFRGPAVFVGYYNNKEKTEEVLESNGWLHTGDIGRINDSGTLSIIDRKKNIFKLAQGEYLAPEKIEMAYLNSQYIAQMFLHGDSLKAGVIAVIVPDKDTVVPWAKENGILVGFKKENSEITPEEWTKVLKDERTKKLIMASMKEEGDKAELRGFEKVLDIYLSPEVFSENNGLLTPTQKVKRPIAKQHFAEQIAEMYSKLD